MMFSFTGWVSFCLKQKMSWLCVLVMTLALVERPEFVRSETIGLYETTEDVYILSSKNFEDDVVKSKPDVFWVVEFYNSWCGHCIRFAPTWKKVATALKDWQKLVVISAIDCSDSSNTEICRAFDVNAFPTMKIFPPVDAPKRLDNVETISSREELPIKEAVLNFMTKYAPKSWPRLQPLEKIEDIWEEKKDSHEYVLLLFEEEGSPVGRQVILDTMDINNVLVRRMLKDVVTKFGINKFPSLYKVNPDSTYSMLAVGNKMDAEDRTLYVNMIKALARGEEARLGFAQNKKVKPGDDTAEKKPSETDGDSLQFKPTYNISTVSMQDLESAIHYSFRQEIAICKVIDGDKMSSLKKFVEVLMKYFPGRKPVVGFLSKVHEMLAGLSTDSVTGEEWMDRLDTVQIRKCISRGSPSSVYVVSSRADGEEYALKKTECHDEPDAVKAFYEEMELMKLDHAYVSGYKNFFVTYEPDVSSVCINIISQYFPHGDLKAFIREYQEKKEAIPEQIVKKVLGEILEGLLYLHEKGIIHRNIKPSNVFQQKSGAMVLGDLGVSTIMGDVRTNTRQTFKGTVFMAPEIGQQPHDQKSDLYSLGGVLLNLLTTSMYSETEFYKKLGEIKESPETLNEVLEEVSEKYSKSMVNTVQALLRHRHSSRPSTLELIKAGFIQECMAQVDSSQLDKRSRKKETASTKVYALTENRDDVTKVLEYIADTIDHETCVADGMSALADIMRDNAQAHEHIDQKARNLISLAMWDNVFNKDVIISGCYVLSNLVVFSQPNDILFTPDVITIIHKIMTAHEYEPEVQLAAANLILALSADENAARIIVQLGGINDILVAMRHARYHATLNAVCCMALWSITVDSENLKVAGKENAVRDVCLALSTHKVSPELCEAAAAALVSLLLDDGCYDPVNELDCVGNLVAAIHLHTKDAKVVKNCCKVLATVVEANEECAYRFLTSDREEDDSPTGIPTIMEAYRLHKDNADVVESIVRLLLELSNYEDINVEMQAALIGPLLLSEVHKRYKENRDIMGPVEEALDRLGAGVQRSQKKSAS